MDQLKVVIIGGGIAGLSAAHYLHKLAGEASLDVDVTVVERQTCWGGKIRTLHEKGFLIEEGPDSFLVSKPWALELCQELDISGDLVATLPAKHRTYILSGGRLIPLPGGLESMLPTDAGELLASPLFSWRGKLRMLVEPLLPTRRGMEDESLEGLIRRRLGHEAYDKLFESLVSGVYGADGGELSARAALPHLPALEAEHGSLLRGARRLREKRLTDDAASETRLFMAPRNGMGALVDALVSQLEDHGVRLHAGAAVDGLSRVGSAYRLDLQSGESLTAQLLILALPAHAAATLIAPIDAALANELAQIPFAPATTVSLTYEAGAVPLQLDAYGYLIPRREQRAALACTWVSAKFPERAPEKAALFRLFFNQASPRDKPGKYVDLARRELADTLGIKAAPRFSHVAGWQQAMPQYTVGHLERMQRIKDHLAGLPDIFLAGNAYHGIGIPDTIRQSREMAGQAVRHLTKLAKEKRLYPIHEH